MIVSEKDEIKFNKYEIKGAYHWAECSNDVKNMNAFVKARYNIIIEELSKLKADSNVRLLDVGCGDGALSGEIYKNYHCEIFGVDNSDLALKLAEEMFVKHNYKGKFQKVENYTYDLPGCYFDIVVCADVIEHVRKPHLLLNEIFRILKEGGYLLIATPIRFTEEPLDKMHVVEWFPSEFREVCSSVFGSPVKSIISHPLFWYEIYNVNGPLRNTLRKIINSLARFGKNVFENANSTWRFYTMQTLILKKDIRVAELRHEKN